MSRETEIEKQQAQDAEYRKAWAEMTPAMRAKIAAAGITGPDCGREKAAEQGRVVVGREDDAAILFENRRELSTEPDMAEEVDKLPEQLAEKFGLTDAQAGKVAEFIETKVRQATMQTHSLLLARIVGFFLSGSENLQARAHGLAHAARMADLNGLQSMRHSARICGCSPEWLRRVAWKWCDLLGLDPLEGAKSPAACEAYSKDKQTNHWRKQTCLPNAPLNGAAKPPTKTKKPPVRPD